MCIWCLLSCGGCCSCGGRYITERLRPGLGPADRGIQSADQRTQHRVELVADGVDQQAAEDWLTNRKAKDLPLTPTAWKQTKDEAGKAGLTPAQAVSVAAGNGWAGFKAKWATENRADNADKFAGAR